MPEPISVHVWSDVACPWCFVGKRRLERAVRATGLDVRVEYHAFELAPDTPVDFSGSEADFLANHKGIPRAQAERMLEQMTELAATEGLRYDFAALKHTRTLLAHQAIAHAKARGRQVAMVERLFSAYFEQGRHVGRVDELTALGAEVGLDPDELRQALEAGTYADAVAEDIELARRLGIHAVPFHIIDGRFGVPGAQPSEVFADVLRRATEPEPAGEPR